MTPEPRPPGPVAADPSQANGTPRVSLLWLALAGGYFAVGATLQLLPGQLTRAHHDNPALVAGIASLPFLVSAVARVLAGRVSDRGWAATVVTAGAALLLAAVLVQAGGWSLATVITARAVMGVGQGIMSAAALPWVVAAGGTDRPGQTAGRFGLSMWSGLTVGPIAASALDHWTHAAPWYAATAATAMALGCAAASTASPGTRVPIDRPRPPRPAGRRGPTPAALYLGLMSYAYGSVIGLLVLFLTSRGLVSDGSLGVFAAGFLTARWLGSALIDRFGADRIGAASALLVACCFAYLPLAADSLLALSAVALAGAGVSLAYPCAMTIALSSAARGHHGAAVAAVASCWDVGLGLSGMVGGLVVRQLGYSAAFAVSSTAAASALILIGGGIHRRSGRPVQGKAPNTTSHTASQGHGIVHRRRPQPRSASLAADRDPRPTRAHPDPAQPLPA